MCGSSMLSCSLLLAAYECGNTSAAAVYGVSLTTVDIKSPLPCITLVAPMDYLLCVSVSLCVSVFWRYRHNVQMLRASLSEKSGSLIFRHSKIPYSPIVCLSVPLILCLSLIPWPYDYVLTASLSLCLSGYLTRWLFDDLISDSLWLAQN